MDGGCDTRTYRAEIVVRSLAPHGVNDRQRTIIDRVESFRERGLLEDVDVDVWGREIRVDPVVRTNAHERYAALESWAEGRGYTLAPGFARRRRRSMLDGDPRDVISFPLICLVLYAAGEESEEDAVRAVFPCSDDERTYTIVDGIEALSHRAALDELRYGGENETEPDSSERGHPSVIDNP